LEELPPEEIGPIAERIRPLLDDASAKVRQAAVRLLARSGSEIS
jgi:hypothetical protein